MEKDGVAYYNEFERDESGRGNPMVFEPHESSNHSDRRGYDKQSEYNEWIESFQGKVKKLILLGETKEKIAMTAEKYGFTRLRLCG